MNSFQLSCSGNSLTISDLCYCREDDAAGSPYNTSFLVRVVSGAFQGAGEFQYDGKEFLTFVCQIQDLHAFERTEVELLDICYGGRVLFQMDKTGNLTVSGEIYGVTMLHSVRFEFLTDQTALRPFADALSQVDIGIKRCRFPFFR